MAATRDGKLDSWKEIADFLAVSVRTAHRWRDTARMPVHRSPTGHVWADRDELETWRRGRARQRWRRLGLHSLRAAAIVAVASGAAWLWSMSNDRTDAPAAVFLDGQRVSVRDDANRTVWETTIEQRLGFDGSWGWQVSTPDRYLLSDIDADGRRELVFNLLPENLSGGPGRLVCYDDRGRIRWRFILGRTFRDPFGEYTQDYTGHILRSLSIDGKPYVLSIATHRLWHPSQVALLDPRTGTAVEEFWHPGALTHALVADLDRDGSDELLLAGVNNPGPGAGSPVLMTLRLPFSRNPPAPTSLLGTLSSGGPTAYVAFARPDVLEAQGGLAAISHLLHEDSGSLVVRARFTANGVTNLTYRLDPNLELRELFTTIDVQTAHDVLAKSGALDHAFAAPELTWLRTLRRFDAVPDGNAQRVPPFRAPR